jgi:hypothetical protein
MHSVTVFLTDSDAHKYPFPYRIGERRRSVSKNIVGRVVNAKYSGPEFGPGYMLYYIETHDGELLKIPLDDLEIVTLH